MAKLHAPQAIISTKAILEYPVRVFAFAGIQAGAHVGRYSYVNRHSFIGQSVLMGRYCSIARNVDIGAENHPLDFLSTHPFQYNSHHFDAAENYDAFARKLSSHVPATQIGHDVWVGSSSVIVSGVTIGTGAVIGANAFVNKDVPPYAIVAGAPARVIRYRFDPETIQALLASHWWDLLPEEMSGVDFDQIATALKQIKDIHNAKAAIARPEQALEQSAKKAVPYSKMAPTGAQTLGAILEASEKERAAKKAAQISEPENALLQEKLVNGFLEMNVPEDMANLIYAKVFTGPLAALDTFDPLDQEILRNKLAFVAEFLESRDTSPIDQKEACQIERVFGQKG